MLRSRETKIKFFLAATACAAIFASSFSPLLAADSAPNPDVDQLKIQQQQLSNKLAELQKQIKEYGQLIDQNRKAADTLKNQISGFDNEINSTELQIQATQTQIDNTNLQIQALQIEIDIKNGEIEQNKKVMAELLIQLDQLDQNSALQMGLGNSNFSDFLDQLQYNRSVQGNIFQLLKKIQEIKDKLESQQKDMQVELDKMNELREQLDVTQGALEGQRRQKQSLLDKTKGNEKAYQKLKSQTQAAELKVQQEMDNLDNAIRAKLGKRTISPAQGVMACPMAGTVTQGYGNTGFTALGYSFHNGKDVAAPAGTPIYAPADGIVVGADTGEAAYGNWVAIKSSITTSSGTRQVVVLLAHMRSFKVSVGQQVNQGDLVGYEGNTGNTTRLIYGPDRGYHLHVTVFDVEGFGVAKGAYEATYGHYTVPFGYTYDPGLFMRC